MRIAVGDPAMRGLYEKATLWEKHAVHATDGHRIIGAFTEEQAARLARLSVRQLRYWDRTGFFTPDVVGSEAGVPGARIYSLRNIVGLRVLGTLRRDFGISLQHLRKVAAKLEGMDQSLWSRLTLYVRGREVCTPNGEGGFTSIVSEQDTLPDLPLPRVAQDVEAEVVAMRHRPSSTIGRIERHRNVARNNEVFAGTRIPVDAVREFIEAGFSDEDILAEYPTLRSDDIKAARRHLGMAA